MERIDYLGVNEYPSIAAIFERRNSDGLPADGDREFLTRWVTVVGAPVLSVVLKVVKSILSASAMLGHNGLRDRA